MNGTLITNPKMTYVKWNTRSETFDFKAFWEALNMLPILQPQHDGRTYATVLSTLEIFIKVGRFAEWLEPGKTCPVAIISDFYAQSTSISNLPY